MGSWWLPLVTGATIVIAVASYFSYLMSASSTSDESGGQQAQGWTLKADNKGAESQEVGVAGRQRGWPFAYLANNNNSSNNGFRPKPIPIPKNQTDRMNLEPERWCPEYLSKDLIQAAGTRHVLCASSFLALTHNVILSSSPLLLHNFKWILFLPLFSISLGRGVSRHRSGSKGFRTVGYQEFYAWFD